jgi:hypothetical protein
VFRVAPGDGKDVKNRKLEDMFNNRLMMNGVNTPAKEE